MLERALAVDECRLTPFEVRMLTYVGRARFDNAVKHDRDPGLGPSQAAKANGDAGFHIRSAKTEFACSVCLNLFWRPTVGDIYQRDVGDLVQVRSTDLVDGRLIVKPQDDDADPFVLVRELALDHYRLLGWLFAWQAKAFPLLTGFGDPAHFVDQGELEPIAELRRWLKERR